VSAEVLKKEIPAVVIAVGIFCSYFRLYRSFGLTQKNQKVKAYTPKAESIEN